MAADSHLPLRNELDRILQKYQAPDEQAAALEEIRPALPHSIRSAKVEDFCELPAGAVPEYDCFTFALDLVDCQERIAVRQCAPRKIGPAKRPGIADALPGPSFLNFLQLPSQPSLESCSDYDVAVYYDKFGTAQHAGKVVAGTIVSKWGMKGALWRHGLWEVPSSYGTSVQFYSHRPKEYVLKRWLDYLCELGKMAGEFATLVLVIHENRDKNLNHEEFLVIAAKKGPRS